MKSVLVVCTGNTCRSVMAEALFAKIAGEKGLDIAVASAGTGAFSGDAPTEGAQQAMQDYGVDVSHYRSRRLGPEVLANMDLVLTMTRAHKQQVLAMLPELEGQVFVLKEYASRMKEEKPASAAKDTSGFDLSDPFGQPVDRYRKTAQEIEEAIKDVLEGWTDMGV